MQKTSEHRHAGQAMSMQVWQITHHVQGVQMDLCRPRLGGIEAALFQQRGAVVQQFADLVICRKETEQPV